MAAAPSSFAASSRTLASNMADIVDLQSQLDELKRAYRSGARTVSYDGKSVTYADGAELRAAIASLESEIARATGTPASAIGVVRSSKGY
ncbi:low affinity Fe/Cu permease [Bradyrhizobium japonicum]